MLLLLCVVFLCRYSVELFCEVSSIERPVLDHPHPAKNDSQTMGTYPAQFSPITRFSAESDPPIFPIPTLASLPHFVRSLHSHSPNPHRLHCLPVPIPPMPNGESVDPILQYYPLVVVSQERSLVDSLCTEYLFMIVLIPPRIPFSIIRYMVGSEMRSSLTPVILSMACHAKPGEV